MPAGNQDVVAAQQVRKHSVDRGHAAVEVPGQVLAGVGAGLQVHNVVGQRNRRRVQETAVDLQQQLFPLEGVFDPLGAGALTELLLDELAQLGVKTLRRRAEGNGQSARR